MAAKNAGTTKVWIDSARVSVPKQGHTDTHPDVRLYCGDVLEVLKTLPSESVNCCVTSPPYFGLRDYGVDGQIGLEETPGEYVERLVRVFREVRRVLRVDGTLWVNIGDSYAGSGKGPMETERILLAAIKQPTKALLPGT